MSASEDKATLAPDFFQKIGDKASQLNGTPAVNGDAPNPEGEDDDGRIVEQIESLCMNCHENGTTRMLLTAIPYFREVIVMSFSCDHCGFSNNEIQAAGTIQPKGSSYLLRLTAMPDFERTVVKSDTAIVKFIELDIEVPPGRGQLSNVEGLLSSIVDDLELGQEARKEQAPEVYEKIAEVIAKGRSMLAGESFPFRLSVDDPAGNSWIAPNMRDGVGKWEKRDYLRTPEQNEALGLGATESAEPTGPSNELGADGEIIPDQVYAFPATCPGCMHPCTTNMKMVDIPHFKAVILMSTVCHDCGYRSNDVKTGGEIPALGKKITLRVESEEDLARDILKSESCALECPELSLQVNPGTLGGRFTTVEGLLTQVRNDLHNQIFEGGEGGDSLERQERTRWTEFFDTLDEAIRGERKFTVILTDPLASSYVQKAVDPDQVDPQMTEEDYERTEEEEEDLGLLDMKTEGYEKGHAEEQAALAAAATAEKEDTPAPSS
ncbi:ZPR1 zinc-finger domain-containing protein [Microdochium trichocladiopsis]|uniref:ZPR1 zinc-finger domain-containing protein n=1 Tax=Microdochium trichocladiopsis TaxID=1682393 RepID=A0A9P8YG76_9PEZI|nr:ZPR1 zinc-finger domain-containing protein [Microdochium trichocladiopsis]KAH7039936.1 ZPR1 zinc-finger domain-containing protein [Microdochium trichocladiopsis]